jgi:two-component system chemotaxis response regulator CheB
MLRVLIVDDTATSRKLLAHIINAEPDMRVVGEAHDGGQAVELAHKLHPDVIMMDITMPHVDGLEATRRIMYDNPTPIVMVSGSIEGRENEVGFQAMRLGALTLLAKPVGPGDPDFEAQVTRLTRTVRTLAGVQVIRHRAKDPQAEPVEIAAKNDVVPQIVVIGASTGGPAAIAEILRRLPVEFPLPVVIAQHITDDFIPSLRDWLNSLTPLHMSIARHGETPCPGHVYVAPGGLHLLFDRHGRFMLDAEIKARFVPSCDILFESAAAVFGAATVGVILTGMGNDGAAGLRKIYDRGGITISQDQATSVVYGMPQEAVTLGAVRQVLSIQEIAPALLSLVQAD